jgi:hypothetical protein
MTSLFTKIGSIGVPDSNLKQIMSLSHGADDHAISVRQNDQDRLQVNANLQQLNADVTPSAPLSITASASAPVSVAASTSAPLYVRSPNIAGSSPVDSTCFPCGGVYTAAAPTYLSGALGIVRITSGGVLLTSPVATLALVTTDLAANTSVANGATFTGEVLIKADASVVQIFIKSTDTGTFVVSAAHASGGTVFTSDYADIVRTSTSTCHTLTNVMGIPYLVFSYTNSSGSNHTINTFKVVYSSSL